MVCVLRGKFRLFLDVRVMKVNNLITLQINNLLKL